MFNFWKKKNSRPITEEDSIWIENNLYWIHENVVNLRRHPTILPPDAFFDYSFSGQEKDAHFVLERLGELCGVDASKIRLTFYSQQPMDLGSGIITRLDEEKGAAGYYVQDDEESEIQIEIGQLKDPVSLIAVMAHELCHYVLIGLYEYGHMDDQENEYLTDLLVIAYGLGIFQGNSSFSRKTWDSSSGHSGWSIGKQGYLPKQVTAYAMAVIELYKGRFEQDWLHFLEKDFKKYFTRSVGYVFEHPQDIRVK
jgi:hypothetical protein